MEKSHEQKYDLIIYFGRRLFFCALIAIENVCYLLGEGIKMIR